MAVETPSLLDGVSLGSKDFRRMLHAALGGTPGSFGGGIGATNGAAHGVTTAGGLAVTQNGTPNMSVDVAAGLALITPTSSAALGPFPFFNDAPDNLSIGAAHATLNRKDLVIAEIRTGSTPRLFVVQGTPHASPSDPDLTAYPDCLVLARVNVAALDTAITNGEINDLRTFAGTYGTSLDAVAALGTTRTTTITAAANMAASGFVARTPIAGVGALYIMNVTAQNLTGGSLGALDDICTLPAGFRPSSSITNFMGSNISSATLAPISFHVSSAGLVEFGGPAATVSHSHYMRLEATWIASS